MAESRLRKNITNLGLDLSKIDVRSLEELSMVLEDYLMKSLRSLLGSRIDVDLSVELKLEETLDLTIDLTIQSPNQLSPDVMAAIDERIDKAIRKFEELVVFRYGLRKNQN